MNKPDDMDTMLQRRAYTPPSPDFAQRIVARAAATPQRSLDSLTGWVSRLFAEFHLMRPAYALACTLLLGLSIGLVSPSDVNTGEETETVQLQGFFDDGEEVL